MVVQNHFHLQNHSIRINIQNGEFIQLCTQNQFNFSTNESINARSFSSSEDNYTKTFKFSIGPNREKFWEKEAEKLHWEKKWDSILDIEEASPASLWFPGGLLNICYNALDVNITNGRGDQKAIIFDSPLTQTKTFITYSQLLSEVEKFAGLFSRD